MSRQPQAHPRIRQVTTRRRAAESGGSGSGRPGGLLSRLLGSPNHRNHVVGVIEDSTTARRAAEALQQEGFDSDDIVLQTGQEIEQRMQNDDIGNLVREAASEEGAICRDFDEQARGGRAILSVYTDQEDEVERVQGIMTQHGARSLKYFGDWTISNL